MDARAQQALARVSSAGHSQPPHARDARPRISASIAAASAKSMKVSPPRWASNITPHVKSHEGRVGATVSWWFDSTESFSSFQNQQPTGFPRAACSVHEQLREDTSIWTLVPVSTCREGAEHESRE
jgi:hypothetical protein